MMDDAYDAVVSSDDSDDAAASDEREASDSEESGAHQPPSDAPAGQEQPSSRTGSGAAGKLAEIESQLDAIADAIGIDLHRRTGKQPREDRDR